MKEYDLGKLERANLRETWEREDDDFTPWLALPENLALLSEAIGGGLELGLVATEENVGPFRADILCKDISKPENNWVLIENQIVKSDHKHLGQLLTYTAGLHAATIIWIASEIQEEHRAALDWLNENTQENFHFFGLEIELWRIGSSKKAPKFNIVSQPNNWEAGVFQRLQQFTNFYSIYWKSFIDYLQEKEAKIIPNKPDSKHIQYCSKIAKRIHINTKINPGESDVKKRKISIEIRIHTRNKSKNKFLFEKLETKRKIIEKKIGESLEWNEKPKTEYSTIVLEKPSDVKNEKNWEEQFAWFNEKLEIFVKVFKSYISKIDMTEFDDNDEE